MKTLNSSKSGMTLIEVLVAGAVLGGLLMAATSVIRMMQSSVQASHVMKAEQAVVLNVIESIRSNPRMLQAFYSNNSAVDADQMLTREALAIAWSPNQVISKDECGENCPSGRMGYVMQTVNGAPGLFLITLHISESEADPVKIYKFYSGVR